MEYYSVFKKGDNSDTWYNDQSQKTNIVQNIYIKCLEKSNSLKYKINGSWQGLKVYRKCAGIS